MCGIAGYFGAGTREVLEKMTQSVIHRGPDDSGMYSDHIVGLGHRRLSIIDLSPLGHQPMWNSAETIAIIFNGEIYNFLALREELAKKGYQFESTSDTEVIIYLYQEYGTDCFQKMNGMFALALYDTSKEKIILARDRLGKKPLYWTRQHGTLIFGSELRALTLHPLFSKKLNIASLNKYLAFDYIPTPHTVYEEVYKLEPGTFLECTKDSIQKTQFWDITFHQELHSPNFSVQENYSDIISGIDSHLEEAVRRRLVSDVPLGVFLSGGLDSSTVAYYAQKNSSQKIKTFSIGFEEKSYDESPYAREVACFLGTEHHEKILTAKDSLQFIPQIGNFIDEPVADYSFIPTYLLSRFTREHVTVALGGDGGDELFFGYGTLTAERIVQLTRNYPEVLKKFLQIARKLTRTSHSSFNLSFKLDRLLAGIDSPRSRQHHAWMGTFSQNNRKDLFVGDVWNELSSKNEYEDIDQYMDHVQGEPRYNQLIYLYLRTYLMDQVLVKVDRMSMATSLEVRAPFLDHQFVDFINRIPYNFKIKGLKTKYLLKKVMENKLPRTIVYRKKQGFGVPLSQWFNSELKEFVQTTLSSEKIRNIGLFNPRIVHTILEEHFEGKRDNRKMIWSLIIWQLWHERWL